MELRERKAQDYRGGSEDALAEYFPFGDVSHFQLVWTKALRLRQLVRPGSPAPLFESLYDTVRDLRNYVDFWGEKLHADLAASAADAALAGEG
jgi:hypothetical protein